MHKRLLALRVLNEAGTNTLPLLTVNRKYLLKQSCGRDDPPPNYSRSQVKVRANVYVWEN